MTAEQQRLVFDSMGLAKHLARAFVGDYEENVSAAMYGLCLAAIRYDPDHPNAAWSFVAHRNIKNQLKDQYGSLRYPVRLPRHVVYKESDAMRESNGDENALLHHFKDKNMADAMWRARHSMSMDQEIAEGATLHHTIGTGSVESEAVRERTRDEVRAVVAELPPRWHDYVTRYYGIGREAETQERIAQDYGVTHQAVNQAISKALRRLSKDKRIKELAA